MAFLMFFAIGVVEMFIGTAWTKTVVGSQVMMSGFITFVSMLIWYYVIDAIVNNVNNLPIVLCYVSGCALGAMLGTHYVGRPKRRQIKRAVTRTERLAVIEHEAAAV